MGEVLYMDRDGLKTFPPKEPAKADEPKVDPWQELYRGGDADCQLARSLLDTLIEEEKWDDTLWNFGFCTLKILSARWMVASIRNFMVPPHDPEQAIFWRRTFKQPTMLAFAIHTALEVRGDQRAAADMAEILYIKRAFRAYTVLDAIQ